MAASRLTKISLQLIIEMWALEFGRNSFESRFSLVWHTFTANRFALPWYLARLNLCWGALHRYPAPGTNQALKGGVSRLLPRRNNRSTSSWEIGSRTSRHLHVLPAIQQAIRYTADGIQRKWEGRIKAYRKRGWYQANERCDSGKGEPTRHARTRAHKFVPYISPNMKQISDWLGRDWLLWSTPY